MKISFKKLPLRRDFPSNEMSIDIESKFIDLEIERREKLKDLVEGCYNKSKYVERIFELFDVSFDEDYKDIVEYTGLKKGIIKTTIPYDNGEYTYNEDGTKNRINRWTYLSYEVVHQDIDLDHIYTFEEVKTLISERKVILLSSKPYEDTNYEFGYQQTSNDAKRELTTIKDYNFENIYKNGLYNNEVVIGMIRSKYDIDTLKCMLSEFNEELLSRLNYLKNEATRLETFYSEKIYEYARFAVICDSKIKKIV